MKPQSLFTHTMDGLRPRPARRVVMLQKILATRQPPLSLRQWRWALAGVSAMMVLALGLAWGLGAYDPTGTSEPDRVTQAAAAATAPEVQAAYVGNGKVQWLPNVALASVHVTSNLPGYFVLERRSPAQFTPEDIQDITSNLEAKDWSSVKVSVIREGYYQLTGQVTNSDGQGGLRGILSFNDKERHLKISYDPPGYFGLSMVLPSVGGVEFSGSYQEKNNVYDVETQFSVYTETAYNNVAMLPLDQAIKNVFYILGGHPALDTSSPLIVNALKLICASGVPYYQFPVRTENGTRYAYALAVAQKDIQAQPELYSNYQDFLAGKSMVMEALDDYPLMTVGSLGQEILGKEIPLDFTSLTLQGGVGENLPQMGALFHVNSGWLAFVDINQMITALQQKGWKDVTFTGEDDNGVLLQSTNAGGAVKDANQHWKLADQFLADSGLADLLDKAGYALSEEPIATLSEETRYEIRLKNTQALIPGFVKLCLSSDKSVIECRIQMKYTELLYAGALRPLSQSLSDVYAFSTGELNEADMSAVQNGLCVTDARLIYVRGIPIYKMTILLPDTTKSFTGYALAITMDELKAFPQELEQYKLFMQDRDETKDSQAMVTVVDPNTGELLASVTSSK